MESYLCVCVSVRAHAAPPPLFTTHTPLWRHQLPAVLECHFSVLQQIVQRRKHVSLGFLHPLHHQHPPVHRGAHWSLVGEEHGAVRDLAALRGACEARAWTKRRRGRRACFKSDSVVSCDSATNSTSLPISSQYASARRRRSGPGGLRRGNVSATRHSRRAPRASAPHEEHILPQGVLLHHPPQVLQARLRHRRLVRQLPARHEAHARRVAHRRLHVANAHHSRPPATAQPTPMSSRPCSGTHERPRRARAAHRDRKPEHDVRYRKPREAPRRFATPPDGSSSASRPTVHGLLTHARVAHPIAMRT